MKRELREYTNIEYVEYLDENLYLLITLPHKQKNIELIRKKIKGKTLDIFNEIILYRCIYQLAHQLNKSIPYSFFNIETLEKKRGLDEVKKETEETLNLYLESLDKDKFLESISEISYWMAKIELKEQIEIHKKHLNSWIEWHIYLEKNNKNKREGEKMKEKLRLILGDKIDDFEKINQEYQNNIQRLKDGKGHIFVDIDREIDLTISEPSDILFTPTEWRGEKQDFRILKDNTECVRVNDTTYTLRKYYEEVKEQINKDWIKSKNILKQIITIYTIKRCQNGDEEAYTKLFNLYKDSAEKIEINFIKYYKNINTDEIEGRSLTILSTLLKGNPPSLVYEYLGKSRLEKKYLDFLNKKPYLALNEAYESMFTVIKGQLDRLNSVLEQLEKNTKDHRNRLKKAKQPTKTRYLKNIFSESQYALSMISLFPTTFMLFDPIIFLNISPKHNKYLFKPAPGRNLTTWLLGDGTGNWRGMIWQELCNSFLGRKTSGNESYDEHENNYTKDSSGVYIKNEIKSQED